MNENEKPVLGLAENAEVSEDGLTYTFTLRDGIKWSNGTSLTASDFKYSWMRLLNPEIDKGGAGFIIADFITGAQEFTRGEGASEDVAINATDDKTLVVGLKYPVPYLPSILARVSYFPINEEFLVSQGEQYGRDKDSLIYCGPYTLTEYNSENAMLVKNPDYWDAENVKIDKIHLNVIAEQLAAEEAYLAGNLDWLNTGTANNPDAQYLSKPKSVYIQFNEKSSMLKNVNIRRALSLAYDINNMDMQNGIPAYGLVPDGISGSNDKLYSEYTGKIIEFNAEEARQYWEQGVSEEGAAHTITLLVPETSPYKELAEFLQSEYKKNLDIDIEFDFKSLKTWNELMSSNNYQFTLAFCDGYYDDATAYLKRWMLGSAYYGNYINSDYRQLMNNANAEANTETRADLLAQAEKKLLKEDAIVAPLYWPGYYCLLNPEVTGIFYHASNGHIDFKYAQYK